MVPRRLLKTVVLGGRSPIYGLLSRHSTNSSTSSAAETLKNSTEPSSPQCPNQRPLNPVSLIGSFHQRPLPLDLISFSSALGRQIFKESLNAEMVENYFSLVGTFTPQTDPAYCGLGSLAMVLNAMEVDPKRTWKGIWRWYSDEMLECCSPLSVVREKGINMDQFVYLSRCHGLLPEAHRHDKASFEQFKSDLNRTATEHGCHMVISFSREALGQTGIGHFSPIGAYNPERQMALVLDVARFKYPPYWAPIEALWAAMAPVDVDTGNPRGYILLKRSETRITGCP